MDAQRAARHSSSGGENERDRLGTTTLLVLNTRATSRTVSSLLADTVIWHVVMALNVGVVVRRDLQATDGEALLVFAARDGWTTARRARLANGTSNTLGLEAASLQKITLA